jgi:hypothetical protein
MTRSIKDLYAYALAEDEGVGTAYEYYVKRRILDRTLGGLEPGARILVAGLPEKYGTSLDFVVAAADRAAKVLLVDDRAAAVERARTAIEAARRSGALPPGDVELRAVASLAELSTLPRQDAVLSCEVLQRLAGPERARYVEALLALAPRGVAFAPNSENGSHLSISGLAGLDGRAMRAAFAGGRIEVGFVDLPPFPPGIKRSDEQRERASTGLAEALAMRGLELYASFEPFLPAALKRHVAHIVYAAWSP